MLELKGTIPDLKEPTYFALHFGNEIIHYTVAETKICWAVLRKKKKITQDPGFKNCGQPMRVFLAVLLYKGIVQKPVEHW